MAKEEKKQETKLTPEQQYLYNVIMDIRPKLEKAKMEVSQYQVAFDHFEKLLVSSIQESTKNAQEEDKKLEEK